MGLRGNSWSWPGIATTSVAVAATLAAWTPVNAGAETVIVEPVRDNTLVETSLGNLSNGAGDGVFVGRTRQSAGVALRRGLLAFDLTAIPAGSTVMDVDLTLQLLQTTDPGSRALSLHRVTADWGEGDSIGEGLGGGQGGPAETGDATWKHSFYDSGLWGSLGGDFTPSPSATLDVGGAGTYTWTGAGLVSDVQAWVDDPASSFGWILIGGESVTGSARQFSSREHADPGAHPRLAVTYQPPVPVLSRTWSAVKSLWSRR